MSLHQHHQQHHILSIPLHACPDKRNALMRPVHLRQRRSRSTTCCRAIHIDRRRHLELAWQRQEQQEDQLQQVCAQTPPF